MTKVKLVYSIFSDNDFNITEFSKIVGIDPTVSWYKGDIIRNGNNFRKETSVEFLFDYKDTLFLDDLICDFMNTFSNKIDIISTYIRTNNLQSKFFFVIKLSD